MISDDNEDDLEELLENVASVTPAVAVSSSIVFGLPLSDWVYVVTIIYTFVGICTMIKKHWVDPWLENKRKRREKENSEI